MINFNLNDYILVQITDYGWSCLAREVGDSYIQNCIVPYATIIDGEEWYRLQGHQVITLFGNALFSASSVPIKHNVKICVDALSEYPKKMIVSDIPFDGKFKGVGYKLTVLGYIDGLYVVRNENHTEGLSDAFLSYRYAIDAYDGDEYDSFMDDIERIFNPKK